jgi:hypothetical protein
LSEAQKAYGHNTVLSNTLVKTMETVAGHPDGVSSPEATALASTTGRRSPVGHYIAVCGSATRFMLLV